MQLEELSNISDNLAMMPDPALQKFAQLHRQDPYMVSLALSESNRRKKMRMAAQGQAGAMPQPKVADAAIAGMAQTQLPENQGIAQIPTPNMQAMADGGIAGYEDDEEGMATGGLGGMFNFAQQSEPVVRMSGGGVPGYKNGKTVVDYRQAIIDEAQMQGVPADVALQISGIESNFDPNAKPIDPKTGKPRSSAKSLFQVIDSTFKGLGGDPKKRNDPMENIRVGVKYLAQNQAALTKQLGRPPKPQELYATHFLGTDTGSKLLSADPNTPISAFLDKTDPKNKEKILTANPEVLGGKKTVGDVLAWTQKKMAPVLTSAIPIGSAQAAPPPNAGVADLVSQIPGSKVAPPAPGQKERYLTGNEGVIGAGETALQYLTGTLAIPTAGGAAVLEQVPNVLSGIFGSGKGANSAEIEKSFREKAAQVTYEPRTVGGKTVSESFGKTLEDLKIPPYLARIGSGASVRRPSAGAADVKALAKEAAATAAEKTKTADTLRLPPPSEQGIAGLAKNAETILVDSQGNALPPKTPPAVAPVKGAARAAQEGERVATGDRLLNLSKDKAEAAEARKAADSWAKAQEATEKADAQNMLADERFGQTNRAQGIATLTGATPATISESDAATAAANAAAAATPFKGVDENELQRMQEANQAPMTRDDIVEAAKEATPAKERKGFSNDDLLTLGLNLLASKSPNFMTALGEAGLATVAGKKEREKIEREQAKSGVELDYMKARTKEAEANAALIERGGREKKLELEAEKMIQKHMADWMDSMEGKTGALRQDGGLAKQREEERVRTAIYASLGITPIMRSTSASSGVGLSASDSALINKYLR